MTDYLDSGTVTLKLTPIGLENIGGAPLKDDFNRASLGSAYSNMGGSTGVAIQGSDNLGSSNASTRGVYRNDGSFSEPLEVVGEFDATIGNSQNIGVGFGVSLSSSSLWDGYWAVFATGAAGTPSAYQIYRIVNGAVAATLIDVRPETMAVGDKILIRSEAGGVLTLAVYRAASGHWDILGQVTDTVVTGPYDVFVRGANTTWRLDNLQAGSPYVTQETTTITLTLTPSFSEQYDPAGAYSDTGSVTLVLTPTLVDEWPYADSGTVYLTLSPNLAPVYPTIAVGVTDDFERASLGSDWTLQAGQTGIQITGSSDVNNSTTSPRGAVRNGASYPQTEEMVAFVEIGVVPPVIQWIGPVFSNKGNTDLSWDGYSLHAGAASNGGTVFEIIRYLAGGAGTTITETVFWSLAVGDYIVGVHKPSGEMQIWRYRPSDGSWIFGLGWLDTTITADLYLGLRGTNNTWRVESYGGSAVGVDTLDSGTIYLTFTPSGIDDFTPAAGGYTDAGTIYLDLSPSFVETWLAAPAIDSGTIYLDFTPSGTEYIHVCKPRFRGELLTWLYDPDAMTTNWYGGLLLPDWYGELLPVEAVVNYAC